MNPNMFSASQVADHIKGWICSKESCMHFEKEIILRVQDLIAHAEEAHGICGDDDIEQYVHEAIWRDTKAEEFVHSQFGVPYSRKRESASDFADGGAQLAKKRRYVQNSNDEDDDAGSVDEVPATLKPNPKRQKKANAAIRKKKSIPQTLQEVSNQTISKPSSTQNSAQAHGAMLASFPNVKCDHCAQIGKEECHLMVTGQSCKNCQSLGSICAFRGRSTARDVWPEYLLHSGLTKKTYVHPVYATAPPAPRVRNVAKKAALVEGGLGKAGGKGGQGGSDPGAGGGGATF